MRTRLSEKWKAAIALGENPFGKGFSPKTPATGDPCFPKLLKVLGKWLGRNPFSKGFLPKSVHGCLTCG
jgi:hypothetical protein